MIRPHEVKGTARAGWVPEPAREREMEALAQLVEEAPAQEVSGGVVPVRSQVATNSGSWLCGLQRQSLQLLLAVSPGVSS
jgi:hypothetical protein